MVILMYGHIDCYMVCTNSIARWTLTSQGGRRGREVGAGDACSARSTDPAFPIYWATKAGPGVSDSWWSPPLSPPITLHSLHLLHRLANLGASDLQAASQTCCSPFHWLLSRYVFMLAGSISTPRVCGSLERGRTARW